MTVLALVFVFIPFFSFPFFSFNSYVQPSTLLIGWTVLILNYELRPSSKLFLALCLFLLYIIILKILVFNSSFSSGDISVVFAYLFGFTQFLLFISLFNTIFLRYLNGFISLCSNLQNALNISLALVILSVPLQLLGPFNEFLILIKPRNVALSDAGLSSSYRGLSGLMPEPSYVGTCLGILLLSSFLVGFIRFFINEATIHHSSNSSLQISHFLDFNSYSHYTHSFLSANLKYIFGSLLAIFLAFSPTSVLSFILILSVVALPFVVQIFSGFITSNFLRYILISLVLCSFFIFLANSLFSQSRFSSLLSTFFSGHLAELILNDKSVADRFVSSSLGLFTIFKFPLGLGLNGHEYVMSDCSNPIVEFFNLMCGSIFNSNRNHNAFANLSIDGGALVCCLLFFILRCSAHINTFCRLKSFSFHFKFSLILLTLYIPFLFVVLPAPLGSPFVWLPFALSIVSLRFLSSLFVNLSPSIKSLH